MKKLFLLFIGISLFNCHQALALEADLFSYDKGKLTEDMQSLQQLEDHLELSETLPSYSELKNKEPEFLEGLHLTTLNTASPLGTQFGVTDVDWGAFAWGFCCCPIGFFTVAVNPESDNYQKLSYWIGVGIGAIISGGGCLIYNLAFIAG